MKIIEEINHVWPGSHRLLGLHLRGSGGHRRIRGNGNEDRSLVAQPGLTITALVPAFNERDGIGDTIRSLQQQDMPFDEIIVVDDGSTDGTGDIARSYGVTVITPPENLGSKARAQNYGLPYVTTDLVIPVDADTVFAPDYVRLIKVPFADSNVAIAAGTVQTRFTKTVWERARWIEYHIGFNWFRPIQGALNAPMVCSGCCTAFRVDMLRDFGGFPERTIVEDIDYTWSQQIMGRKAVYVGEAVAYAAEPVNAKYMAKQLWRWKSGMFQNVRQHGFNLVRHKPLLALWVFLSLWETIMSPVTMLLPLWWILGLHHTLLSVAGWWALSETAVYGPPTLYAWQKRGINPLHVIVNYPAFYVLKCLNFWFDWKAIGTELILVPLGLSEGLHDYEKGRADSPILVHSSFVPLSELFATT